MNKTELANALHIAHEFLAEPHKRKEVKDELRRQGWPMLADLIDETAIVSLALIELDAAMNLEKATK